MKKKAYNSPETEVVEIKIEQLMGVVVGSNPEGITSDDEPDEGGDDNHSRRRRNVWDEEEEDW